MDNISIVSMKNISKRFGGTQALDNVSIEIYTGEVHSFVGVNGAGKSTLMKILMGAYHADSGKITVAGNEVVLKNPLDAMNRGISMVFQDLNIFPKMSIAENILMGDYPVRKSKLINWKEGNNIVKAFFKSIDINLDPKTLVGRLTLAEKQLVEIAKSVYREPKILILDEPSSSLSYEESQILYKLIGRLKERGLAIVLITHKMEEILEQSDRITIIRDGRNVSEGMTSDYDIHKITGFMLGQNVDIYEKRKPREAKTSDENILSVRNLSLERKFKDISFDLKKGEILAITGLVGSGKSELARSIFGITGSVHGKVLLEGKEIIVKHPLDAINNQIGYLPISRKEEGIFVNFNIRKNLTVTILNKFKFLISRTAESEICDKLIKMVNVIPAKQLVMVNNLSGGNQQKVILARWLAKKQKILILDEPTRGIDVGAKHEIYALLMQLAKEGMSIILISSEFDEILSVADRILIMREGRCVKEIDARETDRTEILKFAMAGTVS